MQSEQHIRRLIRELELPDQADLVIQRPKYWTPAFCWLYFERCDELVFGDPQAGLGAAEFAPELAALVGKFDRQTHLHPRLRLRALAVLGSAYRAVGDLEQSDDTYAQALRLVATGSFPAPERANLYFRVAVLRSLQHRGAEALARIEESVQIYRQSSRWLRQRHLGEALTIRGFIYDFNGESAKAMKDWSEALSCTDPQLKPRVHYSATHNLAFGLARRATCSADLARVEIYLTQARKLLSKRPRSLQKLRLIWLQGMIFMRFGSTRRGEAAFRTARKGFLAIEASFEMALVSLDLGRYFYQSHRFSELRALAIETHELFKISRADERAQRALAIWRDAVLAEAVSAEVFVAAWRTIQERADESYRGGAVSGCGS